MLAWSVAEQRLLIAALRLHPRAPSLAPRERWSRIAAGVPGRTPAECLRHCRAVSLALRQRSAKMSWERLGRDEQLAVLEFLPGSAVCALAATCHRNTDLAHEPSVWRRLAAELPATAAYAHDCGAAPRWVEVETQANPLWRSVLCVRSAALGVWQRLFRYRAGGTPHLDRLGRVGVDEAGSPLFTPARRLPYRLESGAICELVRLHAGGGGAARPDADAFHAAADFLMSQAEPGSKPEQPMHMLVREVWRATHPQPARATGRLRSSRGSLRAFGELAVCRLGGLSDAEQRSRLERLVEIFALLAT